MHYTRKWNKYQSLKIWFVGFVAHIQLTLYKVNAPERGYSHWRREIGTGKSETSQRNWISAAEADIGLIKKQKDAEQLISEANDRLLNAAANHNTSDLMAAQAALQSGTMMLTEAPKERENLKEDQQS